MTSHSTKKYIVVVPDESKIVAGFEEINRHIYKTIISKPCQKLVDELLEIKSTSGDEVGGILTRGSLSQFLYEKEIPFPIFTLDYTTSNILHLMQMCQDLGYHRVCFFEMACKAENIDVNNLFMHTTLGENEYYYYKMYDNKLIDETICALAGENKIDVLIGDIEPVTYAQQYQIPNYIFLIDDVDYKRTIAKATYNTAILTREKSKMDFIEVITNIISEGIIIANADGTIEQFNPVAYKLLYDDENTANIADLLGMTMAELLALPANQVITIKEQRYVLNVIPVILANEQTYALVFNTVQHVENLELSIRTQNQQKGLVAKNSFHDMIYKDPKMKTLVSTAKKYARSSGTIIICGKTGTGKEVLASSIHQESQRRDGPFVAINCATFTEALIESELFGYEKGAFTGALGSGKKGLFELAHKGSIFLDEIGELSLNVQAKLLRVLQEKEIRRIGGDKIIPIDVRILAATNKDLKDMVRQGLFREDLYYRLALLELHIPPLKERPADIIPLLISFITKTCERENKSLYWTDTSVFEPVLSYDWPGNVRELRNYSERIVLLAESYKITECFMKEMLADKFTGNPITQCVISLTDDLRQVESAYIQFLLEHFGGNKERLCDYLHISKTTLWRKLPKRYLPMPPDPFAQSPAISYPVQSAER